MRPEDPIETEIMRMNEREMEAREKGFCFADEQQTITDFSHLHALEERAGRIYDQLVLTKHLATHEALRVQLAQTGQEIADEREFLGLEDMSADDLLAALTEPECEVTL